MTSRILESNTGGTDILPAMPELSIYSCLMYSIAILEMPQDSYDEMERPPIDISQENDFERKRLYLVGKSKEFPYPVELADSDAIDDNCHHGNVVPF